MPRIKRWFPTSHDINEDAEVWELTSRYGDRSLRVWLEILSIADRNEGTVPGVYEHVVRALSGKCQTTTKTVRSVIQFAQSKLWMLSEMPLRVRNHAKYHPSRDAKEIPQGNSIESPPSFLPSLTEEEISLSSCARAREDKEEDQDLGPEPDHVAENHGPELALFVEITGRQPPIVNYDRIKAALEGKKKADVLPFFEEWSARGYKSFNMGWLEWVRTGVIESRHGNGSRASPSPPVAHKPPCAECQQESAEKRYAHYLTFEQQDGLKTHLRETLPAEQAEQRYADIIGPWKTKRRLIEQDRERAERPGHLPKSPRAG